MSAPVGFAHVHRGKVRDLYRGADGTLLVLASDRISAFDFVLPTVIPDKGRILTAMTHWWFGQLADLVPNHLIAVDDARIPAPWRGRAMLCRELDMVPVEAVARGYLTGSGLADYAATGTVCGVPLPGGLVDGDRLPEPIFTPTSKAPVGEHDESLAYADVEAALGAAAAADLRRVSLLLYDRAAGLAATRGIILADTKFEFGHLPGDPAGLVLGDEVLTPDSSRFWPADLWRPGRPQPSFDKQFVRDWLTSAGSGWDRRSGTPPPELPEDVVDATRARYVQAYEGLTGLRFGDWLAAAAD